MLKFKNILVPTDFSKESRAAFDYARELAKNSDDARVHFLHVIELTTYPINIGLSQSAMEELRQRHIDDANKKLREYIKDFEKDDIICDSVVLQGKSDEAILKYTKDHRVDVICIGTHGRSGFEHLMIGSTTEKVIRKADCPVLAIKLSKK
ncbi:MAG: universal stress protein [Candidatus Kapaibacterium sp.]